MKVPSHDYKITMASVTRDMTYNDKLDGCNYVILLLRELCRSYYDCGYLELFLKYVLSYNCHVMDFCGWCNMLVYIIDCIIVLFMYIST